ncbi:MAG: IclR family transcriptional regulator [Roseiflexaceae bacterium]
MTNHEVKSAARVLDIFSVLVKHPDGLSLSELCEILSYPKSSTHGLLNTMLQRGYLRSGRRERTYRLGPALFELGSAYIASTSLVSDGWEIVRTTARLCDETVHLAVLDGLEVLYVAKEEGTNTIRMVSAVGKRFPAYATGVGKILLANLTEHELLHYFPDNVPLGQITANTITQPATMRQVIAQARQDGHAIDIQESTPGLCCVAAPVYDAYGQICAGLSISVPSMRFTDMRRTELITLVTAQSHALSVILGYTARPNF